MNETAEYTINELSEATGVEPRTIHYYIKEGLIPSSSQKGSAARYGEQHVVRLKLVRQLQAAGLRLSRIRSILGSIGDEEARSYLAEAEAGTLDVQTNAGLHRVFAENRNMVCDRNVSFSELAAPASRLGSTYRNPNLFRSVEERWTRVTIVDGVEVALRDDLPRHVRKTMARILDDMRRELTGSTS
jgi:DNA-binding transcriptional MerR regulator